MSLIGKRPLLITCAYIIGILSFYGLFQSVIPLWIPIIGIGLCDGAAASLIKSLYVLVVQPEQVNNSYAASGSILNLLSFGLPPLSGIFHLPIPTDNSGIIHFFAIIMIIGLVTSLTI